MKIHYTWYDIDGNIVAEYVHSGSIEAEIATMKQRVPSVVRVVADIALTKG